MNKWRYTRDTLLFSFPISLILRKFSQSFKLYFHAVYDICRSSHRRCSVRKNVLRNFAKFTGKRLFQSLFFNKVAGLKPVTLLKKQTLAQVFSCKFCEISKNTYFTKHLQEAASLFGFEFFLIIITNAKCCLHAKNLNFQGT